jgi:hypothetical protein
MGAYYFKGEAKYEPGVAFLGGGEQALAGDQAFGVCYGRPTTHRHRRRKRAPRFRAAVGIGA